MFIVSARHRESEIEFARAGWQSLYGVIDWRCGNAVVVRQAVVEQLRLEHGGCGENLRIVGQAQRGIVYGVHRQDDAVAVEGRIIGQFAPADDLGAEDVPGLFVAQHEAARGVANAQQAAERGRVMDARGLIDEQCGMKLVTGMNQGNRGSVRGKQRTATEQVQDAQECGLARLWRSDEGEVRRNGQPVDEPSGEDKVREQAGVGLRDGNTAQDKQRDGCEQVGE